MDRDQCNGCLWAGQCDEKTGCEDYTPYDDSMDIMAYELDLEMRYTEYLDYIKEFNR